MVAARAVKRPVGTALLQFLAQLNVPVGEVEEMLPALVSTRGDRDVDKGSPLGSLRFANQSHAGLCRGAVGFPRVAWNARAHDVFPGGGPAAIARNHVVEVKVFAIEPLAAVLTSVVVALENIVPREFDLLMRKPVEEQQQDDARDANFQRYGVDNVLAMMTATELAPFLEIERLKLAVRFRNHLCVAGEQ